MRTVLIVPFILASACNFDFNAGNWDTSPPPTTNPDPTPDPPANRQTMSDVHVQPDGSAAWVIHIQPSATGVKTTHLGVFDPAARRFDEVLDTTGTLGKKIVFPSNDRFLLVTSTPTKDVLVLVDTATHVPIAEQAYEGDLEDFALSPSGKLLLATDLTDNTLHVIDTATLASTTISDAISEARWATTSDQLYAIAFAPPGTSVVRYDLRDGAAATQALVGTIAGSGYALAIAPDDRFAAVTLVAPAIGAIDLATGTSRVLPGECEPAFTNDDRVISWTRGADQKFGMQLIDPTTGAQGARVATDYSSAPTSIPLRAHDLVIAEPYPVDFKQAFIYDVATGTTKKISEIVDPTSRFERPDHAELWMESFGNMRRLDLATGLIDDFDSGLDSVDYRRAADDIIVGTNDHSLKRFSMATTQYVTNELVLRDPNTVTAPYKLATPL